jgi:UDP-N-acetylglucosamine acyltransferase
MVSIHPTAIIDGEVTIGTGTTVGPYVIIRGRVEIGQGVNIDAHSVIEGHAEIGDGCRIGPAAFVGTAPQHRRHDPALPTWVVIGPRTVVREGASVHRATATGRENATRVGTDCYLMCHSHVGHDCTVGDGVTLANATLLGGHVTVGDGAFLGGGSVFHPHVRVGRLAVVAGNEPVSHDVPPFAAVRYGGLKAYNAVGCRRAGMSQRSVHALRRAFNRLAHDRVIGCALAAVERDEPVDPAVAELLRFVRDSHRGIVPACGAEGGRRDDGPNSGPWRLPRHAVAATTAELV